ncbi:MAG TPA: UDP-glucose--hexose-1-phosphate uridylyltransferase [Candidatus Limnocylindrales bacterium]|nr:UDP-glucose--hexose-1-phosphate uridylyltransferase [Candidatus Limnocylindrales bacterium]
MTSSPRDAGRLGVELLEQPHRRYDPLADEWLLVSAGRTQRPWSGRREGRSLDEPPAYDPDCYLCPGNTRASGERNPDYTSTFAFTNDFAALRPDSAVGQVEDGLLLARGEQGTCVVLCFSPRHDLTMPRMPVEDVRRIVDTWAEHSTELGRRFAWVQVFENRGAAMGASNPHPHGQIWAAGSVPSRAGREDETQRRYLANAGRRMLLDYASQEAGGEREVEADEEWLIVVPFWAAWPYETLFIPRRPVSRLPDLDTGQRDALTERLIGMLNRYDDLFDMPFPYSMGWHQAPYGADSDHWQLHAHIYPPLLTADRRKFMVGYELLSELQRDITPESAAEHLRAARPGTARE